MNDRLLPPDGKRFGAKLNLSMEALMQEGLTSLAARELHRSLVEKLLVEIEMDKSYVVRMQQEYFREPPLMNEGFRCELYIREIPVEEIRVQREWRVVEVDAASLHIEAINCKNCAAPIPVGTLDRHGDTLVRCSYCGTYHTIRKRG